MVRLGAIAMCAVLGSIAAGIFSTRDTLAYVPVAEPASLVLNSTINFPLAPDTSLKEAPAVDPRVRKTSPKEQVAREAAASAPAFAPARVERVIPSTNKSLERVLESLDRPVRVVIPSINLDTAVIGVGLTANGEMDVPDGTTSNVGWYELGTIPGNIGSAVMDAHVYAALKNLRYAKVGEDVYITTKSGRKLQFKIDDSLVYALAEVPLQKIFNRKDDRRLNFITCSGTFSLAQNTYTHRLVVYTRFISEVTD